MSKTNKVDLSISRYLLPKVHPEGWKIIAIAAVIAVLFSYLWMPLGILGLVFAAFCYFFFRDPDRILPEGDNLVVSPADGIVCAISDVAPPKELDMGKEPVTKVSIFLSVLNVHVNRVPATGKITKTVYHPGLYLNASLDKASEDNERQVVAMETADGKTIAFTQIAGLIARRIVCTLTEGQTVTAGERFGLIRFGSRMDIYLPKDVAPSVKLGQTMIGGETIIARL